MNLSTSKLLPELRALHQRRQAVLRRLLGTQELAVGTVSWVDRKCGRPGCHCAQGPRHRQMQFLFADAQGRRRCKLVRKADEPRLVRAGQRYRTFRTGLRELAAIHKREHALLMALRRARGLRYK
jgi:hypothetical protein